MNNLPGKLMQQPFIQASLIFMASATAVTMAAYLLYPLLFTLLLSGLLYAAMFPTARYLTRRGVSRTQAVVAVMAVIVTIVLVMSVLLYPLIAAQLDQLSARTGSIDARLTHLLQQINELTSNHLHISFDPAAMAAQLLDSVTLTLSSLQTTVSSYFNDVAFSLFLVPLITFFLLRDFRVLRNQTMQLLPNRYFELGWMIYNAASSQLQGYLRGISIQMASITLICTAGFWLAGIDFAPLLGILTGLLNLIPIFGIALAKIPPLLVVLLSDDPSLTSMILALAVVFAAQIVDTAYILPRVIAKSANLHPVTVMVSVSLAGYYFGFTGLIAAVPLLFSAKVFFLELLRGLSDFSPLHQQRIMARLKQSIPHTL
ncbi:AI-2E family transporter [Mariprofundus erugo]|uniref:AI-2E family transporter n=1 Tax=Mariprofundus erugo TaxID=2528639 RepID=A0A5R9GVS1_9PROT|nr:AI-2E family transporter [Mariprofundus erugo]TLS69015.1 AI-2E family transporter [Mariprofundus erugo]TLS76063.1 AI-2E family transporter [Mariprofundus erugo]